VQSLSILDVPARTIIQSGSVIEAITHEAARGEYDLLVVGTPLTGPSGKVSLSGAVGQILETVTDRAILVIRSRYLGARTYPIVIGQRNARLADASPKGGSYERS